MLIASFIIAPFIIASFMAGLLVGASLDRKADEKSRLP